MDAATDHGEIGAAWRALDAALPQGCGWKTIRVAADGPFQLRAGRHFPGGEEGLLVGFRGLTVPRPDQLPIGNGFAVQEADLGPVAGGRTWIGLWRQASGRRDLFGVMVEDIVGLLRASPSDDEAAVARLFLSRIRAWQEFMDRGWDAALRPEAELGLVGELEILGAIINAGSTGHSAVDHWLGPLGGIHDFAFRNGAIEVKTTTASGEFPVRIGSLEQLDNHLVTPLFIACVRMELSDKGRSLTQIVRETRTLLDQEPAARQLFDTRLLQMGYLDTASGRYSRRFRLIDVRLIQITDDFPRLVRGNVPRAVMKVEYQLDADLFAEAAIRLIDALKSVEAVV